MSQTVSLQSLLKRTMRSSDGKIVTSPINGRVSCVLDNCGTAKKLADNHLRVLLYVYDANTGDVVRDEKSRPYTFNRQYKNLSVSPWLRTDTAHESNAQVKHAVAHCDVLRDERGNYLLNADGTRQFKWSVVPDTFVWIANAERPELQGMHQFGDTFESIVLEAQTKGADLVPACEDDADLLADFDLERA
ncbi:hypothetical protein [Candidatus Cryosericum septentrionale]|jgi:hypothetical protein|uniref:Uncharacterized protein n=1 Tax=Candidatus Cryosericum septentrionale TaxID=2290913 RepID=A0A398DPS9_9BACT|nr:hypothetical protein [Candidatus Cryosericum septentrionale]RIE17696.1 hypothetical protein SMC1_00490 [Candidatus Cryosericum septentrionale]